jgi:hypothetical protein
VSRLPDSYERIVRDRWSVWIDPSRWREDWWAPVLDAVEGGGEPVSRSRHARTSVVALDGAGRRHVRAYVKVYAPSGWRGEVKDLWRSSKALNALSASDALGAAGFAVAPVLAAGEERRLRRLRRAFFVTEEVPWPTLVRLAGDLAERKSSGRAARSAGAERRAIAAALGDEVGRLHRLGWAHGDLVATNVLVERGPPARVCLIDHDRTRRVSPARRATERRRNLVQLNRLLLARVGNADRLRFFIHYAAVLGWPRARWRPEARRLAEATRRRRTKIQHLAARRSARAALP